MVSRKKKPNDGLCELKYEVKIRIEQAEARAVSLGEVPASVGVKLKEALEEDLMLRSRDFVAWYNDPPNPSDIKRVQRGDTAILTYTAANQQWEIDAERHRDIVRLCARVASRML